MQVMRQTVLMLYGVWGETAREVVSRRLQEVPGVKEVRVGMYRAEAVIVHDDRCTPKDLVAAVIAAGEGEFRAQAADAAPHDWPTGGG
jgi:copper chaperone CopZ